MSTAALLRQGLESLAIPLPPETEERLLLLLEELLHWNRRINLTAITDPAEGVEKHLLDSLTLLPLLQGEERLLDVGSGGGFPGIPLKIACPSLKVHTVDAVGKKVLFQRHIGRLLGLENFTPVHARIEDLSKRTEWRSAFDLIVSRAFADLSRFAGLSLPLLAPRGRIIAMKGPEGAEELAKAGEDLAKLDLRCGECRRLKLPASGAGRVLIVLEKSRVE